MPAFRLAHISDLHLPPPAGAVRREPALKRLLSRFAWRRKRHRHSPAVLAALVADLKASAPDHIAITGDLTNFSTTDEFAAARTWLEQLGPPADVTVSPGNHDALVGAPGAARFAPWRPWLGDAGTDGFPQVRRRDGVALVNLCSAIPTAPHLAQGELGAEQLARLRAILAQLRAEGLCRVLLIHHPPAPGVVSGRKSLRDGETLREVLRAEGAELILHGHGHEAVLSSVPGPLGPIPIVGAPSASAVGGHDDPARWQAYEIEGDAAGWTIRVVARGLADDGSVVEMGRYRLTSRRDSASSPGSSGPPAARGSARRRTTAR